MLAALLVLGFASCKKEDNGGISGVTGGKGAPTVTSIHTVSKSVVDSALTTTTTVYNSSGVPTTTTTPNYNPQVTAFDSVTTTGNLGNYYVLYGTNLGSTTKIVINGVSIYFNRALNSDKSIVFSIPTTVPYVQPQANTIIITTLYGAVTYKFTVLPPPPTITGTTDYSYVANQQITLTGKGFASVSAIKLKTTSDPITIVSENDSTLVMKMPAVSAATESALLFTYTSGSNAAAQTASTVVFNDLDNSYQIFVNGQLQNGWFNNSWSYPSGTVTSVSHAGSGSFQLHYPAGGWQVEGMADWNTPGKFPYDPTYKYLTFWIKGGTVTHTLVLVGDQMVGGYGQVQNANAYAAQLVTVPAKVWTFFKIPLGAPSSTNANLLNFWANGTTAQQLGFFLMGQTGDVDEDMYFDEMAFIK
ncbi:hypothetical protein JN11_01318 [Mucilaginibacter frigoritolerans]|uniref:IPT/TIG domain-containing protein n=2 Tax=Mucilaginibacter frigoritolerans TaxID=652788 RepID=A0A562U980_9SPHI|nr:hypothetical protein JN11_01318 [Mucilaginibacter frigoritolerans]